MARLSKWLVAAGACITVLANPLGSALARPPEAVAALRPEVGYPTADELANGAELHAFFSPRDISRARLRWNWRRFSTAEYVTTGLAASTALAAQVINPSPGRWRGGILFDEDARDSLRLGSYQSRRMARDVSDVLVAMTVSYPVLVDGLIAANWYYESPDVAEQLILISTETLAITAAVQGVVSTAVSRERPYGRTCGTSELGGDTRDCEATGRHRSFYSGHSSMAFAGASLVCINRAYLPLHGGGVPDAATCVTAYAAAATTAALRVAGDMHYASDVMVGASWGTLAGLSIPWLLHYRHDFSTPSSFATYLVPFPGGVAMGGHF
ncbi:MAG: phosphatase PAP2 family protein [Polyangiaceae bacterium]